MDVRERANAKRDRAGRYYRELRFLEERGEQGARPDEIATAIGMSRRTVYRDLQSLQGEMEVPLWSDEGRWGVTEKGFLPPLKLTLAEAMAIFLSARLMARFADEYDPDLAGAFQKVAVGLPPVLAEHVARTLEVMARRPLDERLRGHVRLLTQAWADRRVVRLSYDPAAYDPGRPPREARVHPYLIEPSSTTHALYLIGFDEARGAIRTFKIERILSVDVTPQTRDPARALVPARLVHFGVATCDTLGLRLGAQRSFPESFRLSVVPQPPDRARLSGAGDAASVTAVGTLRADARRVPLWGGRASPQGGTSAHEPLPTHHVPVGPARLSGAGRPSGHRRGGVRSPGIGGYIRRNGKLDVRERAELI